MSFLKKGLGLFIFLIFTSFLYAGVKVKLRLTDENRRSYEYQFTLSRREENKLDYKFQKVLEIFRVKGTKKVAEEKGYAEEIYGKENYKLIEIKKMEYVFFSDDMFRNILHTNRKIRRIEDF